MCGGRWGCCRRGHRRRNGRRRGRVVRTGAARTVTLKGGRELGASERVIAAAMLRSAPRIARSPKARLRAIVWARATRAVASIDALKLGACLRPLITSDSAAARALAYPHVGRRWGRRDRWHGQVVGTGTTAAVALKFCELGTCVADSACAVAIRTAGYHAPPVATIFVASGWAVVDALAAGAVAAVFALELDALDAGVRTDPLVARDPKA